MICTVSYDQIVNRATATFFLHHLLPPSRSDPGAIPRFNRVFPVGEKAADTDGLMSCATRVESSSYERKQLNAECQRADTQRETRHRRRDGTHCQAEVKCLKRQANCRTIEMRAFDEKILEYIIKMERMKSDSAVTPIVAEVCWLSWAPTVMKKSRFTAVNVCEDGRLNVRLGLCRGLNGDDQSPQFFPPREDDTFR